MFANYSWLVSWPSCLSEITTLRVLKSNYIICTVSNVIQTRYLNVGVDYKVIDIKKKEFLYNKH